VSGGADANQVVKGGDYLEYTNTDRNGMIERLGSRLLVFDTHVPEAGWKELTPCPGSPRFSHALTAARGMLFVIGGASGNDNGTTSYATVVDNWRYDPGKEQWSRLPDTPLASGNFPGGSVVYENRYIMLVGGGQYNNVINPDGTFRKPYGKVYHHYESNDFPSDVLVFDTQTNRFGVADPLP
jgi:Galactose oxidase, central domain